MSTARPRLYDLLPAYIRFRDAYEGEPLRTLMTALEIPFGVILEDLDALYRGWFIETCEDWEVPYIGDLVGVRGLERGRQPLPSQRTGVANALAYRRSKGTPAALERAAADATGWACHAVDYRRALAVTASFLDPSGTAGGGTADLRRMGDLDGLDGPFNVLSHTADLRPSDPSNPPLGDRGGFHLLNLGLAFWRLESFPVSGATPCEVVEGAGYTFHPFGIDIPLFNPPQTAVPSVYTSSLRQLPVPLSRAALASDIAARRRGEPEALGADGFFAGDPAFRILVSEAGETGFQPVPPAALEICDLKDWTAPAEVDAAARVAVDPVRGRFLFLAAEPGRRVRVDYSYGLSMDLGGGPYPRQAASDIANSTETTEAAEPPVPAWRAMVAQDCVPRYDAVEKVHYFATLGAALQAWSAGRPLPIPPPSRTVVTPRSGLILICDSGTYEAGQPVNVKGRWLAIQAAAGCCPAVRGAVEVVGSAARMLEAAEPVPDSLVPRAGESPTETAFRQSQLVLGGLRVEGGVDVTGSASLVLEHCTIAPVIPGRTAFAVRYVAEEERAETIAGVHAAERTVVRAVRCILGALDLAARPLELDLVDCLVDGGGGKAIDGPQAAARLVRCTVFGEVELSRLSFATGVLFERRLRVAVPSEGTIRFSYLPSGSRTPPQERCIGGGAKVKEPGTGRAAPVFTARSYGDPAYAQLSPDASFELRRGGEDGNEIGVYNNLRQSDRLANLATVLDEFLPWGMNARVSFVT